MLKNQLFKCAKCGEEKSYGKHQPIFCNDCGSTHAVKIAPHMPEKKKK